MKKQLCIGMMGLLALGFLSCSDDESEVTGGGFGLVASTTPQVVNMGIKYPVTEARKGSLNIFKLMYSDGRVVGNENDDFKLVMNPLRLICSDHYGTEIYQNFKTNSNGYVTYCENHGSEDDEEDPFSWDCTMSFAYDKEGHLLFEKSVETYSDGENDEFTITYTWENGNLKSIEEHVYWYDEDGPDSEFNRIEFQYDEEKYPNTGVYYCTDVFYGGLLPEYFFYTGMLGRTTNNIPISYKWTDELGSTTEVSTLGVNYNQDGSVRTISLLRVSNGYHYFGDFSYGYENYPLSSLRASVGMSLPDGGMSLRCRHEKKRNKNVK